MRRVWRAVVSVSDKRGLVSFASDLARAGTEILSTGGTAKHLRAAGIAVREIREVSGFPEMLGGRVRTLHPLLFGGILARRGVDSDREEMERYGIPPIDLVVMNFYPFAETVARPGATEEEIVESIDIGGPSLLRAAAKSFDDVAVLFDPEQYGPFLERLRSTDGITLADRRALASRAFRLVADYDERILAWFERGGARDLPAAFHLAGTHRQALRYGENPHQTAAWYDRAGSSHRLEPLQGKELSYNNLADSDSAWRLLLEFEGPAAAIVKHGNPCGAALGPDGAAAFRAALSTDPLSAFGGIVAVNTPVDGSLGAELEKVFLEVVLAPSFDQDARSRLAKKKNLRLVRVEANRAAGAARQIRILIDGFLVQSDDHLRVNEEEWRVATDREPTEEELRDARFAWRVAKHVRSNAIVLARGERTVGIGAGQMSRVDSTLLAVEKAGRSGMETRGSVLASDGFFPFPDSVERAHEAGVGVFVQPGGSIRDKEVIAEANRLGAAMILTGARHFRH
ncbi:MAG: bifunctional phosphoribosylaminoimidazolecarboxamide formyltransferase/IMP cyclohydrolase [Candidatus Eisenbacteria bacterium]